MNISEKVYIFASVALISHAFSQFATGWGAARHGLFISDFVKPHAVMPDEAGMARMNEQ